MTGGEKIDAGRRVRRRGVAALGVAAAATAAWCGSAGAVPPYYELGPGAWTTPGPGWSTTTPTRNVWQISAPAGVAAPSVGWQMTWGCPVPGSEISAVHLSLLRFSTEPSAVAAAVSAGSTDVWTLPDALMPVLSATNLHINLPPGSCSARLALIQTLARPEGARSYVVGSPSITVRDLDPPSVRMLDAGGWVATGQARATLRWRTDDNFGAAGVEDQIVTVAGRQKWRGRPGVGPATATLDVSDLPDGVHALQVVALGAGTANGVAEARLSVDRTPPVAQIGGRESGPGRAVADIVASDGTSGIAGWQVHVGSASGRVVARGAGSGPRRLVGLDLARWQGKTVRLVLTVQDRAGNARADTSAPFAVSRLPNLSRARLRVSVGARSRSTRRGGERVLQVLPGLGQRLSISGRLIVAGARRTPATSVTLRAPDGRVIAASPTGRRGHFGLRMRVPSVRATYRIVADGRPGLSRALLVTPTPRLVLTRRPPRRVSAQGTLTTSGRLLPASRTRGLVVQLEYEAGGRWQPIAQSRVSRSGRFSLGYRLARGGGYGIRVRVRTPQPPTGLWQAVSRTYQVSIG